MLPVAVDEDFVAFVTSRRSQGQSSRTIAGALNASRWADEGGTRWNGSQVAKLCWSETPSIGHSNTASGLTVVPTDGQHRTTKTCDREDCLLHRRLAILHAIRTWLPFDSRTWPIIANGLAAGESHRTIASRLSREKITAPNSKAWSAALVRTLAYLNPAYMAQSGGVSSTSMRSQTARRAA